MISRPTEKKKLCPGESWNMVKFVVFMNFLALVMLLVSCIILVENVCDLSFEIQMLSQEIRKICSSI